LQEAETLAVGLHFGKHLRIRLLGGGL